MALPVYVIGHKHPDTDSICSAIALAELKKKQGIPAVAARLGHVNPETNFILEKLNVDYPLYMNTARCTLEEIQIDQAVTINHKETIRHGWDLCVENHVKTLYVVDDADNYMGIVTINDISTISMQDVNITKDLLKRTPLSNIVKALKGKFLYEGHQDRSGYVRISDKRLMERDLKGAIMVLDDHEDDMLKSMAHGCAVVIVTENYTPTDFMLDMAKAKGVTLIQTGYNIMKVIQMIYRSIPVSLIMTEKEKVVSFNKAEFIEDVEHKMLKTRHSNYPVVFQNRLVGSVARYHLLKSEKRKIILVDHNEIGQAINDIETAEVIEIVDHHRIGDIETSHPISFRNMTVGSTCTIIEMMYRESGIPMTQTVAHLIAYGVISDTMNFHSPTCTQFDKDMKERLEKEYDLDFDAMAKELFKNTATIKGKEFKDILYNDNKEYLLSGYRINVAQVFTYDLNDVNEIETQLISYMKEQNEHRGYDLMMLVITDVEGSGSRFITVGKLAQTLSPAIARFADQGYVSRKKQIVPSLAAALI